MNAQIRQADRLARLAVFARDRYRCLYCGKGAPLEWCHIITRAAKHLRWEVDNAVTLCRGDHAYFTEHPVQFRRFIAEKFGPDHRDRLLAQQAAAERRGDSVDVEAVIRGFKLALTPAESARYAGGDW